jgi:two-component system, OmpR family, phosphate regulon response regulator PhoB
MVGTQQRELATVLFVEDDPAYADMYRLKLELDGYTVRLATDGQEALQMLEREALPDLVFLDVRLPRLDGLSLLRRLRESQRTRALPVVIVSNYGEQEQIQEGLELGALDYLVKANVTPSELSRGVERWTQPPVVDDSSSEQT